jgi:hypothetical protein
MAGCMPVEVAIYAKRNTARLNYTLGFVFGDLLRLSWTFYSEKEAFLDAAAEIKINYSAEEIPRTYRIHPHELLFETDHVLKNKFLGERPNIFEIGDRCPGRVGRWVGWEIVKAYMEKNPELSLVDLMNDRNANKIFQASKYKPRN